MKVVSYIERDPESGLYVAFVPALPGAHTQAATLAELFKNLQEVIELCVQELSIEERRALPEFVGVQQLEVNFDQVKDTDSKRA
jgi:predicted RNase H-like HicB family nuclease